MGITFPNVKHNIQARDAAAKAAHLRWMAVSMEMAA